MDLRGAVSCVAAKSKADGRLAFVRLTAKGLRLADAAIDTDLNDADHALAKLSAKERANLARFLQTMNQHVGSQLLSQFGVKITNDFSL